MDPVEALVVFIRSLGASFLATTPDGEYGHIGATLTDAVLQGGINYENVVRHRVELVRIRSNARETSGFLALLEREGSPAVLDWREGRKPATIRSLATLLIHERVETEAQLRRWLRKKGNAQRLYSIKGIGPKTVDYLQILVGIREAVAVDRHARHFIELAGVPWRGYEETRNLIARAASGLDVSARRLDHAIWRYMSAKEYLNTGSSQKSNDGCHSGGCERSSKAAARSPLEARGLSRAQTKPLR